MSAAESPRGSAVSLPALVDQPLSELLVPRGARDVWDRLILAAIAVGLIVVVIATFRGRVFGPLLRSVYTHGWMLTLLRPSLMWMAMGTALLAFRTALWFYYRPF